MNFGTNVTVKGNLLFTPEKQVTPKGKAVINIKIALYSTILQQEDKPVREQRNPVLPHNTMRIPAGEELSFSTLREIPS